VARSFLRIVRRRCYTRRALLHLATLSVLAAHQSACGPTLDGWFGDGTSGYGFSDIEWARLQALTNLGEPPPDRSNRVANSDAAVNLGQAFFFDDRFSGPATQLDALARPAAEARAPLGQSTGVSCASCHELTRMGIDVASTPGNVSSGAGWTDVNALAVVNSAYQHLYFWNGRADSLWALAAAVAESPTTMASNRLHVAWVIVDLYRQEYEAVFSIPPQKGGLNIPLFAPPGITSAAVAAMVETNGPRIGQCALGQTGQCAPPCRLAVGDPPSLDTGCWPMFPLNGRPGSVTGCQPGDPGEPFGDAWDCMFPGNRDLITRVLVNWAKAIAAYEMKLVSVESPFDRFMREGLASDVISSAARRGARLFVGKAGCIDCHGTPLLSDQDFHNIGISQSGPNVPTEAECPSGSAACDCINGNRCLPWGALDGLARLQTSKMLRTSVWSDAPDDTSRKADLARAGDPALKGAWRTPSLRGVSLTAPYMHDGVYRTLQEVVAHYSKGGDPRAAGTRAAAIKPLLLTDEEQAELVAFLETLTGPPLPANLVTAPPLPPTPPAGPNCLPASEGCRQ
jgi:cytochrome c peroxidase